MHGRLDENRNDALFGATTIQEISSLVDGHFPSSVVYAVREAAGDFSHAGNDDSIAVIIPLTPFSGEVQRTNTPIFQGILPVGSTLSVNLMNDFRGRFDAPCTMLIFRFRKTPCEQARGEDSLSRDLKSFVSEIRHDDQLAVSLAKSVLPTLKDKSRSNLVFVDNIMRALALQFLGALPSK
jgi:hypothetical protein